MKQYGICSAVAGLGLAACNSVSADQAVQEAQVAKADPAALIKQSTDKVCYTNSSDQVIYLETRLIDGERGGFMFQPNSSFCIHRDQPLETWVRQEEGGAEICSGTIGPGYILDLTKQDGSIQCNWRASEHGDPSAR